MTTRSNNGNGKAVKAEIVSINPLQSAKLAARRKGELTRRLIENDQKIHDLSVELGTKQETVQILLSQRDQERELDQLESAVEQQEEKIETVKAEIDELDLTIQQLLKKC